MGDFIKRFTTFDRMIASTLIKVFYWIGLVLIALGVLFAMLGSLVGMGSSFLTGLGGFIIAPIIGLIGLIFWRLYCELIIVIFGIYDRLGEIRDKP